MKFAAFVACAWGIVNRSIERNEYSMQEEASSRAEGMHWRDEMNLINVMNLLQMIVRTKRQKGEEGWSGFSGRMLVIGQKVGRREKGEGRRERELDQSDKRRVKLGNVWSQ